MGRLGPHRTIAVGIRIAAVYRHEYYYYKNPKNSNNCPGIIQLHVFKMDGINSLVKHQSSTLTSSTFFKARVLGPDVIRLYRRN